MHVVLFALNGALMIVTPLVLGTWLAHRYGAEWGLFGAGAATFVASQLLHLPFNAFVGSRYLPGVSRDATGSLLMVGGFYGLSAGVFEESARYITFRFWRRDARSWAEGLMVGAGHGGIEALIVGLLFVANMAVMLGVEQGYFTALVPPESLPALETQAAALFTLPLYETILGGVERVFTIVVHLALSLMVLRSVRRKSLLWLLLAISWHALLDAAVVVTAAHASAVVTELGVGVFALVSLLLIYAWHENAGLREEIVGPRRSQSPGASLRLRPDQTVRETDLADRLDDSRYL